jgi:hypothetical protein
MGGTLYFSPGKRVFESSESKAFLSPAWLEAAEFKEK